MVLSHHDGCAHGDKARVVKDGIRLHSLHCLADIAVCHDGESDNVDDANLLHDGAFDGGGDYYFHGSFGVEKNREKTPVMTPEE